MSMLIVVCRLPSHLHEVQMKVRKAEKELADKLLREPTQAEVAKQAGITEAKLHTLTKVDFKLPCYCMLFGLAILNVDRSLCDCCTTMSPVLKCLTLAIDFFV